MFSSSNSFLGGGNGGRPGAPQFSQQSQYGAPFGQASQQGFAPQQTGYGGAGMQPQYTGLGASAPQPGINVSQAGQQQQQQFLGAQAFGQSSSQGQPYPQQQPQQRPPASVLPQRTGQTSSEIAQSFRASSSSVPQAPTQPKSGRKVPNIRLSFITSQDQAKFEQLFKSAVGEDQALSGDKARDLLLRSKLPGDVLAQIWTLSDTTKSGQLLFPEFALAMYLCNLKLVGKDLPSTLPETIANEVSSMVDIISFGIPDAVQQPLRTNAPSFDAPLRQNATSPPAPQQPQPQQPSQSQLLSQLTIQPTGMQPQIAGFQPQPMGFSTQPTGFQSQMGAHAGIAPATGYSGPRPPMPPMPTGFGSSLAPAANMPLPLNAQPTGRPGQWGLVNTPSTGLPNIGALQQRMMPQPGREGGFTTAGLAGNATIPWAVTKDEKKIYDQLFRAWDGFNKGYIGGDVAIEIFGQSGLEKSDLERIWTLADSGNKGRLNLDEFAVAMHLIYRKLNNYDIPSRLPPDLVPPSTRNFTDSIGTVKSLLSQDAESRKSSGAGLLPQNTGVSYLKTHSFRTDGTALYSSRKDATVFKNNDDDFGYRSSARRRLGAGGRSPSPAQVRTPSSEVSNEEISIEQLRKKIREKKVLLDAIDFRDENQVDEDDVLDRRDRRDADDLYRRIRNIQEDIDRHPHASFINADSDAEKRALRRQLQSLRDRLPDLASQVRRTERNIADAKIELFRLRDAREHPGAASAIVGTGPNGEVTESDRLKARAKAMMQQRAAALAGKKATASENGDDAASAAQRLEAESLRVRSEKESNERTIRDVEDSVEAFGKSIDDSLKSDSDKPASEHERRRWEEGLGVEEEVKDFIYELQRSSRSAGLRRDKNHSLSSAGHVETKSTRPDDRGRSESLHTGNATPSSAAARPGPTPSAGSTYSSYKTPEERAAFIKQQAEQRMAERLAALGIRPATKGRESSEQRQGREVKEREDRLRQAEVEDTKREQERQRRLADEQNPVQTSPARKPVAKKPPPPPSRKSARNETTENEKAIREAQEAKQAEVEKKERELRAQQEAQESERKVLENEANRQEEELAKEREAAQARLKALEEQVKQGKIKKEEEKRRKQAAQREAKEKEARVAAQRAELEAAKERERQLQLQLEQLGDESSSDDEGPQEITPQETTPTMSSEAPRDVPSPISHAEPLSPSAPSAESTSPQAASPVPSVPVASAPNETESKNPFLKKLAQAGEPGSPVSMPATTPTNTTEVSTNPFHRLTQGQNKSMVQNPPLPAQNNTVGGRPSRVRPEEDEWSVVSDDNASSEDDEDDRPGGGRNASHLASMLFGAMGPPPASTAPTSEAKAPETSVPQDADTPTSPSSPPPPPPLPSIKAPSLPSLPNSSAAPSGPPLPPPLPSGPIPDDAGPAGMPAAPPPPPPPPPPATAAPPVPAGGEAVPPARGMLLGEIQAGKALKKVETKDRSQSSAAGRVL